MSVRVITGDCRTELAKLADESVLAYCAGVIDSDGCIGIKRNTYSMRVVGDSTQATFSARITVRQVTPEAVTLLAETFGGNVRPRKAQATGRRSLFEWNVRDQVAERALRALLPFLRIKKAQAENCLSLREAIAESKIARVAVGRGHAGAAHRPQHLTDRMEALKLRANELNRVGA